MTLLHDFILNIMFCSTHSGTDLRKCSDMQLNFTRSCREYILNLFSFAIKRYKESTLNVVQKKMEKKLQGNLIKAMVLVNLGSLQRNTR